MSRLLVLLLLALATPAVAAPAPFVVYHSPAPRCDVRPVSQACRNAEQKDWRDFLADKLAQYFPRITNVRLADLHDHREGTVRHGWTFDLIAPSPPSRWRQLAITVGGVTVGTDSYARYVRQNTLVVEVAIERSQLSPGAHRVEAKDGSTVVFAFDLELEGTTAPPPVDPKKLAADAAAAATRAPFLVAVLPTKPPCKQQPAPAGCAQSVGLSWIGLFTDTLPGHPHATTFARKSRPDAAGHPIWHWNFHLVFPTAPANWLRTNLEIELDRKPALYSNRYKVVGTESLQIELTLLEAEHKPGKHELRAIDRATGKLLFSSAIELEK